MPAVGLAEAGVCAAASGGRRFSIVSLGPALRPGVERIVAGCGASGGLASIRYVSAGVLRLARDRAGLLDEIVAVANRAAAEDRAEQRSRRGREHRHRGGWYLAGLLHLAPPRALQPEARA